MTARGFPIVQFIFEEQKLFMNEKCSEEDIKNESYCEEAKAVFGHIFSAMMLAINAGSFTFGFLYLKIGGAYLRLILGVFMTTGLFFISFYKTSPYFFYFGMVLSSTGIIMWIPLNTMIGPIFKHNASYVILFLSALVVGSGATFWYGKLAYYAGFAFDSYVFIIAIASTMTILRTLLLFPSLPIPKDVPDDFCMFRNSILGRVFCRNQISPDAQGTTVLENKSITFKQCLPYLFHPVNIALMAWDCFGFFRSYTFIGWMVPWLNHGFHSHVDACTDKHAYK
ncbi:unnamed protein product, partial [Oikopleura dioica]